MAIFDQSSICDEQKQMTDRMTLGRPSNSSSLSNIFLSPSSRRSCQHLPCSKIACFGVVFSRCCCWCCCCCCYYCCCCYLILNWQPQLAHCLTSMAHAWKNLKRERKLETKSAYIATRWVRPSRTRQLAKSICFVFPVHGGSTVSSAADLFVLWSPIITWLYLHT